jgi:hypothetical protein
MTSWFSFIHARALVSSMILRDVCYVVPVRFFVADDNNNVLQQNKERRRRYLSDATHR